MRVDGNAGATKGYFPNSLGEWEADKAFAQPVPQADGPVGSHEPYDDATDDCFARPGALFRLMTGDKRALLIANTAADMQPVTKNIKYRHAAHCYLADPEYGTRLAAALELSIERVRELAAMGRGERLLATRTE